jgi:uncharacterized membrane protein (UPF0127 family)
MKADLFTAVNETRGVTVVPRLRRADTFFTRLRGLTFRRALAEDEGLWLLGHHESRVDAAIHMFFVFFSIGVIWLDDERVVVDKVVAHPFRPFYAPRSPAKSVLECQPAALQRVSVGDTIDFVSCVVTDET